MFYFLWLLNPTEKHPSASVNPVTNQGFSFVKRLGESTNFLFFVLLANCEVVWYPLFNGTFCLFTTLFFL